MMLPFLMREYVSHGKENDMNKPNAKRIGDHFGVASYKLNQDLNNGFLMECVPIPRKGMPRRWDEKAFIATHFYFDLQDQGMSRSAASKLATAIAVFAERNPDETVCAAIRAINEPILAAVKISEIPAPNKWTEHLVSVSFFNIAAAKKTYQEAFFSKD